MASTRRQVDQSGTQSIERAIHLLKLLTTRSAFGWGLTELAQRSGLDKATVHRILGRLERDRLVQRDSQKHRYLPGPMLVELGLSVSTHHPLLDEGRKTIHRLAQRTGGVSFFYLRSGTDFVVAGRIEHKAHTGMLNEIGYRRPLIMSAGGIAMLVAMPAPEREEVVRCNLADSRQLGVPKIDRFERMLERSLELGYSANLQDVAAGIHSFAAPILDDALQPIGSISIAGEPHRFPAAMGRKIVDLLAFEAAKLGEQSLPQPRQAYALAQDHAAADYAAVA